MWVEQETEGMVLEGVFGWKYIRNAAQEKVVHILKEGYSTVYDENNPKKEHRDEFREAAKKLERMQSWCISILLQM